MNDFYPSTDSRNWREKISEDRFYYFEIVFEKLYWKRMDKYRNSIVMNILYLAFQKEKKMTILLWIFINYEAFKLSCSADKMFF